MAEHVLVTGGAGFIGSHVCDELLNAGYSVRALDNLEPQVHGAAAGRPVYLDRDVELIVGDVRDPDEVEGALEGVDAVIHLAARVGVGQSMYALADYTSTNCLGTATLLEALAARPVERLIVASSMSIYGEGLYRARSGDLINSAERTLARCAVGDWELRDADGAPLVPLPTPETKPVSLKSAYALNKFEQERLCLLVGDAYRIPTLALRFFNVFGPRQALSNPYTGVLAIFASRLLNGRPPMIYEDGQQRRDFVSVYDVAHAVRLALEAPAEACGHAVNIASGRSMSVREIAALIAASLGVSGIEPDITGVFRVGDIRHCFADVSRAKDSLGFEPGVRLDDGIRELAGWLCGQRADDRVVEAHAELATRGLAL